MACKCAKCGMITTCGEKYCEQCFINECLKTDVEKNLASGGKFYGVKLLKEDNDIQRER